MDDLRCVVERNGCLCFKMKSEHQMYASTFASHVILQISSFLAYSQTSSKSIQDLNHSCDDIELFPVKTGCL